MPDNPFAGRKIASVAVFDIGMFPITNDPIASATVSIDLPTKDGGPGGAQVRIGLGFDAEDKLTLKEFQLAALERALLLLRRISDETPESLREIWIRTCIESQNESSSSVSV